MPDKAVVSVIIPIYNIVEYIESCLVSVMRQTYDKLQIILVDDGSTDHSGQICDQYKMQDNRILVIHKQNEGLVRARKTGLQYASGEYVCYVDGDDWIEPDLIEKLMSGMSRSNANLIVSNHFCHMGEDIWEVRSRRKPGVYDAEMVIPTMLYTGEFYEFGISQFVWAKLFQKDLLWDVQMMVDDRISCGEDVAVTYPYILKSQKTAFLDYAGYHYRQRVNSMTGRCDASGQSSNWILLEYLTNVFRNSAYWDRLQKQLNQYAKNLLLTRQLGWFDAMEKDRILMPYGGIPGNVRVVIFGAGKLGQSIYSELMDRMSVKIVKWVDSNFKRYQKMRMEIDNPKILETLNHDAYDFILIGVINPKTAKEIQKNLVDLCVEERKIKLLCNCFIEEENNILST